MLAFVTYLPYQTLSLLVAWNSYENISRVHFINKFNVEATGLSEDYLYPDTGQDYLVFSLRYLMPLLPKFQDFA